jgi:hypothetical protein
MPLLQLKKAIQILHKKLQYAQRTGNKTYTKINDLKYQRTRIQKTSVTLLNNFGPYNRTSAMDNIK